ncbi:MAG: hypothetical protein U1E56_08215 [Bauldia sp.]
MKKRAYTTLSLGLLLVALGAAAVFVERSPARSFEQEVAHAEMIERGPQSAAALAQYGERAIRVFGIYGQTPEFADVLSRYGHNQIVPIVDRCLKGGDGFIEAGNNFNQILGSLVQFRWPKPEQLTPEECGWQAILLTLSAGNDFLGQFAIDNAGEAKRLPGSSVAAAAKSVATGGLQGLEKKLVLGEETTWRDWGAAALNLTAVGLAARSVSVAARARIAATASRPPLTARLGVVGEGLVAFARGNAPRIAKYATFGGVIYLAIHHPAVISGAVKTIAEVLSIDPTVLQVLVWGAILFLPAWAVLNAVVALRGLGRGVGWLFGGKRWAPAAITVRTGEQQRSV